MTTKDASKAELRQRIAAMEAELAELKRLVTNQPANPASVDEPTALEIVQSKPATTTNKAGPSSNGKVSSRRRMLKGGAVAAGAALAGAVASPKTAAAADGGNLVIGGNNTSAGGNTRLNGTGTGIYVDRNVFTVSDQSSTSSFEAAIGAYGEGDRVYNGLYAYTGDRVSGDANTGHAIVAANVGGRSNILLRSGGFTPTGDSFVNTRGQLRNVSGNLWFCTESGTPGTWRRLAGPQSAGAVHAIAPARVYDSRFSDGPLTAGFNRVLSVANAIDPSTGGITQVNVVPDGATAVYFNVAITQTSGAGFLLIAPATTTTVTASTVNWTAAGTTVANGSLSTLDSARQLRALTGGSGSTHFIVDITGYTI